MKLWKVMLGLVLCLALFAAVWQPTRAEAAADLTVYLDPQSGDDTADGLSEATAVKAYNTAYDKIKTAGGGTIVFLSTLELTTETGFPTTAATVPVTVTSKTGAEGISSNNNIRFKAPTTVENMTFTMTDTGSNRSIRSICGEGKKLTIGKNVTSVATDGYYFNIHGGARWASCSSTDVTIESGTWRNVYVGTYGYNNGTAKVTGKAKLTMTGGTLTGFITPSYSNDATVGSMEVYLSNMTATSIYCAPAKGGTVTGDVTVTLGQGAKISGSVYTGGVGAGSVNGNVNVILDGADTSEYTRINNGGSSDFTGTVGSASLTLQSGVLAVAPKDFDTVAVDVPAGNTLTVSGITVAADTAKGEGTVAFAGAATLNAKAVTGTLNCAVTGEVVCNQNYVIAPAGASVVFPEGSGVTEDNGKWACRNLEVFKGLVVTVESGVTFNLYQGFATDTKVEPMLVEGNVRYYANLQGKYRYVASRSGYTKVSKNIYVSAEEAQTRMEETVSLVKRDKAWDLEFVRRLTDEALAVFPSDRNLWPEYAEVFTVPVFEEGRKEHKLTTQSEMEAFIAEHDGENDNTYVYSMGTTPTTPAFNIPLVIFTETDLSGADTLEAAAAAIQANGKPTVYYYAQIHGNEYAAGEAALGMIALLSGSYGDQFTDTMNILVVPRMNPDGAYQDMRRIPTQNLDPNRDFTNLELYEVQRQHYVYNLFYPELVIDGHEYNVNLDSAGIAHKDIMILSNRHTYADAAFKEQANNLAFRLFENMKDNDLSYGWYTDAVSGNGSNVGSTYAMQRGSLYLLLESYGIYAGTYNLERRAMAHVISVEGALRYVDENADTVNKVVNDGWDQIVNAGKTYGNGNMILLDGAYRDAPELYIEGGKWVDLATGTLTDRTFPAEVGDVVKREREAPTAYIVPADHEKIDYILWHTDLHGISHYEIPAGAVVMAQHVGGDTTEAVITQEQKTVFANGAYVFGMDQRSARILALLMEPDVTDNAEYNSTYAMAGVFTLESGEYPVYRYVQNLNSDGKIDYTLVRQAPQGLLGDASNGVISGLAADKLYEYRTEGSQTYTAVPAGATQITGLAEGKYFVRFQASGGQEASAEATVALYSAAAVYLDQTNGSDDNDGYTEAAAVKTMAKAISQLAARVADMPADTSGKVVFLTNYTYSSKIVTLPSHDFPLVLTSKDGTVGIVRSNTESYNRLAMGGDTTMENMTLTLNSGNTYSYLLASGHKLTIGENVTCAGSKYFMLVGGEFKDSSRASADMTVKSGIWQNVYMGGYQGNITGDVSFTMTGGKVINLLVPSYNKAISGNVTVYLENADVGGTVYMGNANSANVGGNVDITLGQGVTMGGFYAGSRDAGNVAGTVTVTVDGADLTGLHLYGKAANSTGTVSKSVLVYKSGTLGTHSDFTEFKDLSAQVLRGDMNGDGNVTDADALYLLRHTLFADRYPIDQSGDVNGDGDVTDADALYLLRFTLFPERYPLN